MTSIIRLDSINVNNTDDLNEYLSFRVFLKLSVEELIKLII